jgi:hypothetical protein
MVHVMLSAAGLATLVDLSHARLLAITLLSTAKELSVDCLALCRVALACRPIAMDSNWVIQHALRHVLLATQITMVVWVKRTPAGILSGHNGTLLGAAEQLWPSDLNQLNDYLALWATGPPFNMTAGIQQ